MHDAALAARLRQPLTVGGRTVPGRLWLAPMAGLGHAAFREVVEGYGGCGLLFTGMCNARAVPTERPEKSEAFSWREGEPPRLVCQLFGAEPEHMAEGARRVQAEGFFGVDLNMGCSVSAIVKRGCGADLLRDPERAVRMVAAVRRAVDIPVFVKFRTGWSPDPQPAVDLARRFEDAGADCLVFHPRVAPDRRTQPPRRAHIGLVRAAVSIPVMGNGDVFTPEDCAGLLDDTGCDGVSLGRIAVARPWVFAAWTGVLTGALAGGPDDDPARNPAPWREAPLALLDALARRHGPARAVRMFGKFLVYITANYTYGNGLRGRLLRVMGQTTAPPALDDPGGLRALQDALRAELDPLPAVLRRPSALLFGM
ncbi:tRNA dihydrouridine synthase [Nitratidesulfovibrio sp. D1]|uniref:tRNA dihydrouridine synthase n=1 Tax=Nitratidesulfovibrio sp. D1 TaxID=3440151 RepID=UPI003EBB53A5